MRAYGKALPDIFSVLSVIEEYSWGYEAYRVTTSSPCSSLDWHGN